MKRILLLVLMSIIISCSATKSPSSKANKDDFFITRRYIGRFTDYRHTGPEIIPGTDLIWIKTDVVNTFGKISAYGKTCDFSAGDKIYLKSTSSTPGTTGLYGYQIENDSSICYRVSEYQYQNKAFVRAWSQ
jgi:hypothetical protein